MKKNIKKKGPLLKADDKKKGPFARAMPQDIPTFMALGEGTSANPGVVLGLEASSIDNPTVVKKLLQGVVLPANKKTVGELELDVAATRFFHTFS